MSDFYTFATKFNYRIKLMKRLCTQEYFMMKQKDMIVFASFLTYNWRYHNECSVEMSIDFRTKTPRYID